MLYETALGVGIACGPLLGALLGSWSRRGPFFGVSVLMGIALVATLLLVLIPVCAKISALSALAVLTVIMVGLIAYEAWHFAELRYRIRHGETSARQ